jgi:hypothetical protein
MKKVFSSFLVLSAILAFNYQISDSQKRVVFLPFQNMDGALKLNIYSYKLQDSLSKAFYFLDKDEKYIHIIPLDSIDAIVTQMNLDPTNPQYPSDIWKAVKMVNAEKVVTGNFNILDKRFLINAYIYDVRTKLPNSRYQVKDIFRSEEEIMSVVSEIIDSISAGLIPK